jgi:UTP-glucose-1-phosphate uridylyltransferase
MKPTLLIMAAGMASRYGSLKQIDPVGLSGETIMEYSIYDAIKAGFEEVVFVIRKCFEKEFCEIVIDKLKNHVKVDYVFQEIEMLPQGIAYPAERQKPWGASQAVLCAGERIKTPFAVINADDYYGQNAFKTMHDYMNDLKKTSNEYAMIGYQLQNTLSEYGTVSRGICQTSSDGHLTELIERTKIGWLNNTIVYYDDADKAWTLESSAIVSMNFWGFTPVIFEQINRQFMGFLKGHSQELKSEYPLPNVVDHIMKAGEATVMVLPGNDKWFGITYKEDKPIVIRRIRDMISAGAYPKSLW